MENKKSAFHYAWVVFIATVVMNFFFSVVYSSFNLYAASILEANPEISRTAYSIVPTLHSIFATVFLLLYGKIVQKLGFRLVMLIGGLGIGIGYFIYSMATNMVMFYIGAIFVGVFPAFCSSTTTGAIVNRWFGKLNTTLLSISMAIGGFGGTLGSIIVGKWLGTIGYVASFRYMAILIVVVMVVVFLLVRNSPQDKNTTMLWASGQDKVAPLPGGEGRLHHQTGHEDLQLLGHGGLLRAVRHSFLRGHMPTFRFTWPTSAGRPSFTAPSSALSIPRTS